jgi:hypothetical protein
VTGPLPCFQTNVFLSCPSTPPLRLSLSLAAEVISLCRLPAFPFSTLLELLCPSAFQDRSAPFFTVPFSAQRRRNVALFPRGPILRVWLPSRRCLALTLRSVGLSFKSQHSWASLFRAFILHLDRSFSFEKAFPLLRFLTKRLSLMLAL